MRRTRGWIAALAATAAWAAWAAITAPAPATRLAADAAAPWRPSARGAYHIHSQASDGTGSVGAIADAAAAAGLDFVILTDHGDGTRDPGPPRYHHGVLVMQGVEVSTAEGHYAVLDLPPSPYPLLGDARDVAEDVARLGGFGIAAHPDSAKRDLSWRAWDVPFDAVEWFNADSQWRDEARWRLAPTLIRYFRRPAETVAALFDRPAEVMRHWDALAQRRRVVALAGHDAHQRLGLHGGIEPDEERFYLKLPTYEAMFRSFSIGLDLDRPLTRKAETDARAVLAAIRAGRVYTAIDAVAGPAQFAFDGRAEHTPFRMGDAVPLAYPVIIRSRSNAPAAATTVLLRNGAELATAAGGGLEWQGSGAGVYRIEVRLPGAPGHPPIPWIVSNPAWVGVATGRAAPSLPAPVAVNTWPPVGWTVEQAPGSEAGVRAPADDPAAIDVSYRLGTGVPDPYVAVLTTEISPLRDAGRLGFRVSADRPTRLSAQLRVPSMDPDARWRRSVYADTTPRDYTLPLTDFRPVRAGGEGPVTAERIAALLFVVDHAQTRPGSSGRIRIDRIRTER